MRPLMIIGGLLGFAIGLAFGLFQDAEWPTVIWRASVVAFAGGILLRWWGKVWIQSLQEVRRNAAASENQPKPAVEAGVKS